MSDLNNLYKVTVSTAKKQLIHVLKAGLVPMIMSSPGVGKSSLARDIAATSDLELIDVRLSQVDSPELNGYPDVSGGIAKYIPFNIFPTEATPLPPGKKGWLLLLDEANSAPRHVLAAAYKLVLDKTVGQHKLHPRCAIMMAGNRKEDRAIVNEMGSAMQSRIIHFHLETSLKDWSHWAAGAGIDNRVIGFVNFQPHFLNAFDPEKVGGTFPCERTWEFMSKLVKGLTLPEMEEYMAMLAGTVGPGAATEFMNFVRIFANLPSLSLIIADPMNAVVPTDPGVRFAMAVHIADRIDLTNVDKLAVYLARLQPEAQVVAVRLIKVSKPDVVKNPNMSKIFIGITKYL